MNIAACGINCSVCTYHNREKNACKGCRNEDGKSKPYFSRCIPRNCAFLSDEGFCTPMCSHFPCRRIKDLNKRYSEKYHTEVIENLKTIFFEGLDFHLAEEERRWQCPQCEGRICMHTGKCFDCGYAAVYPGH